MLYNKGSDALSFIARKPRGTEQEQKSHGHGDVRHQQDGDDDTRTSTHGRLAVRETKVVIADDDEDDDALVRRPARTQVQYNLQTIQVGIEDVKYRVIGL